MPCTGSCLAPATNARGYQSLATCVITTHVYPDRHVYTCPLCVLCGPPGGLARVTVILWSATTVGLAGGVMHTPVRARAEGLHRLCPCTGLWATARAACSAVGRLLERLTCLTAGAASAGAFLRVDCRPNCLRWLRFIVGHTRLASCAHMRSLAPWRTAHVLGLAATPTSADVGGIRSDDTL